MTSLLADRLRRDGRSLVTVVSWAREWLDGQWELTWQQQLPHLRQLWTQIGEPAYGTYNRNPDGVIKMPLVFAPTAKGVEAVVGKFWRRRPISTIWT